MLNIMQAVKKSINILIKVLPILSFTIPFFILYSLYPKSFETTWTGRTFYIFFLWLASLEMILNWEKLQTTKTNTLRSIRTVAFIIALLLPTLYAIATNYYELNTLIVNLFSSINLQFANLMPLSTEYLVFTVLFALIILLQYGIYYLSEFSVSILFLGLIGFIYTATYLYPYGKFSPFQILVPTTATLAANVLNLMGYKTEMSFISNHPQYGSMTNLKIIGSQGRSAEFGIAWACAGIESLLIYAVIILLFLKKLSAPWKHKLIYFVIGAMVTYFINIFRIIAIVMISMYQGYSAAMEFHDFYGQLYSITWIVSYPLIIIGSKILWRKIK